MLVSRHSTRHNELLFTTVDLYRSGTVAIGFSKLVTFPFDVEVLSMSVTYPYRFTVWMKNLSSQTYFNVNFDIGTDQVFWAKRSAEETLVETSQNF